MNGILEKPTCRYCGFSVGNDCVVGAGCPRCEKRLLLEPTVAAGPGETDFAVLRAELDAKHKRILELEAALKGGSHGGA